MALSGWAYSYDYKAAETLAKKAKRGLWSFNQCINPFEFRKLKQ
jgi:endonuclease YncB( thermonuclease family)